MLGQRRDSAESLSALGALDLHATIGVHPLVPAQIRKLGVRLEAHLTLERLHRRMDVRVLLEARRGGESFATLWTGVAACAHVLRPDVSLKIRRIGEDLQSTRKERLSL
jgi:hypothetical protein